MSQQLQRIRDETSFIETSGGILTDQLIRKLRKERTSEDAVQPNTFSYDGEGPSSATELETEISQAWENLKEQWDSISGSNEVYSLDTTEARKEWILPLLETLGFDPVYQQQNLSADGIEANLSHLGWSPSSQLGRTRDDNHPPVTHLVRPDKDEPLDSGNHDGTRASGRSPHDELQRYLNAADTEWGLVTDGLKLRLLRTYYHTYTRGYIEFDLENIFTNRNYGDFRALYRLCHVSRFESRRGGEQEGILLEQLYQVAIASGVKIGQDLQQNVIDAIEVLGNGFIESSDDLRGKLDSTQAQEKYYEDLLFVVYRLLFLLYAEQRGMLAGRDTLYSEEYSISRLRERATTRRKSTDHNTDLWRGLEATFDLVEKGNKELNVPCYNGVLFDDEEFSFLDEQVCTNDALLEAVELLTIVHREGVPQRISYADLGVEEIGSVYESLLEFQPEVAEAPFTNEDGKQVQQGEFYLSSVSTERKETGSYYTDPGLVNELIEGTLLPVLDERLKEATSPEEKEHALLNLDVCDPACGSAAFLVAANNALADRLATIRTGDEYPPSEEIREARRDVLQHCIYGVDLNPMAVELAKVSLWINSAVRDKPLNFLDHHIRCGNALIGVNEEMFEGDFPVDAYDTSGGRDWHDGNEVRKRVRNENKDRNRGENDRSLSGFSAAGDSIIDLAEELDKMAESTAAGVEQKQEQFNEIRETDWFQNKKLLYDTWAAAFYWPMDGSIPEYPTPSSLEKLQRNPDSDELSALREYSSEIAAQEKFFHWELEFPSVFLTGDRGFDCIIGNPPWEKPKISQREWFLGRNNEIATEESTTKRNKLIKELSESEPELYKAWQDATERADNMTSFLRNSGRFNLSAVGDLNTYPIFTELGADYLSSTKGRSGLLVKTGIATDYHTRHLFGEYASKGRIDRLYDFENTDGFFEDVEKNERFCLLTICGVQLEAVGDFSFHNQTVEELRSGKGHFRLTSEDFKTVNPNTLTCPTFKDERTRDIAMQIYRSHPILIDEDSGRNTWDIEYHTMFHMSNDDDLFADNTIVSLREQGLELDDRNRFVGDETIYRPLYEGKFISQLDHRFGTFENVSEETKYGRKAETYKLSGTEKKDPKKEVLPRYWVQEKDFKEETSYLDHDQGWVFAFRNVARSHTDFRTTIGTITPQEPHGHSVPVLTFDPDDPTHEHAAVFTSIFTSFVFDFALRSSLSGANVTKYVVKQLPMPTPEVLKKSTIKIDGKSKSAYQLLVENVVPLIWTSHSLNAFGEEFDFSDSVYEWNEDERFENRATIEAIVAKIYGISKNEFSFIMEEFDILKEREINELGRYHSMEKALDKFDRMSMV
ncbi:Eco57I restriction-modification methylase domain-containing protein [Natronobacterium texcoconense]|uniref:site-specific DNA-methyltransferase (adenine-specific) n=1 Tax=Natronobacterium texcoconense TaxID=1095778 RepID=A0A1H1FYE0_NATTX|nr:N-6 DNA methylase [Natronobacterium texcoconense]SDR05963.1 Methyltransferase domain-containing protein [Natronobacterium texcoconense]